MPCMPIGEGKSGLCGDVFSQDTGFFGDWRLHLSEWDGRGWLRTDFSHLGAPACLSLHTTGGYPPLEVMLITVAISSVYLC